MIIVSAGKDVRRRDAHFGEPRTVGTTSDRRKDGFHARRSVCRFQIAHDFGMFVELLLHIEILRFMRHFCIAAERDCGSFGDRFDGFLPHFHIFAVEVAQQKIHRRFFDRSRKFDRRVKACHTVRRFGALGNGERGHKMRCHSDRVYHARFPCRSRVRRFARKDDRRSDRIEAFRFKLADMPAVDSVCAFRLNRFERHLIHAVPRLFVG